MNIKQWVASRTLSQKLQLATLVGFTVVLAFTVVSRETSGSLRGQIDSEALQGNLLADFGGYNVPTKLPPVPEVGGVKDATSNTQRLMECHSTLNKYHSLWGICCQSRHDYMFNADCEQALSTINVQPVDVTVPQNTQQSSAQNQQQNTSKQQSSATLQLHSAAGTENDQWQQGGQPQPQQQMNQGQSSQGGQSTTNGLSEDQIKQLPLDIQSKIEQLKAQTLPLIDKIKQDQAKYQQLYTQMYNCEISCPCGALGSGCTEQSQVEPHNACIHSCDVPYPSWVQLKSTILSESAQLQQLASTAQQLMQSAKSRTSNSASSTGTRQFRSIQDGSLHTH